MADPFVGEIRIFAGNFAPKGWAFCNGQLLQINQNTALFSLLGTTYGGNGQTLPSKASCAPALWHRPTIAIGNCCQATSHNADSAKAGL